MSNVRSIVDTFELLGKPGNINELKKYSKPIDYKKLEETQKKFIDKLKSFNWNKDKPLNEYDSLKNMPEYLILYFDNHYLLVDRQGFSYARYAAVIKNLPNPEKGIKDVFKEDCTIRNPEPPCLEGFKAKVRPQTGAKCCYKN